MTQYEPNHGQHKINNIDFPIPQEYSVVLGAQERSIVGVCDRKRKLLAAGLIVEVSFLEWD